MLKNYLKTTLRSFKRQKSSFFINIAGLSIGLACSFLIFLWVIDELNVDQYHENSDQIFMVMEHQTYTNEISTTTSTPGLLARSLKEDFPDFEYATTYTWPTEYLFTKENQSFRETGLYVENDFFNILSIDLIFGNRDGLLINPNTIVLSESMAKKYFGDQNPVGKAITINNLQELTVTGVFSDMPDNSTLKFDCLLRYEDWLTRDENEWALNWDSNGPKTLVKLSSGSDTQNVTAKIKDYIKTKDEYSQVELFVYPFSKLYLYSQFENKVQSGGRIEYVRLFTIVAIFILLIACINFMNLSTAKAAKRSKEVGIRKSIGASKGSLIGQFLGESMIISFFSLIVSIMLVELSLPLFNALTEKTISVDFTNPFIWLMIICLASFTGLVSGSYPAFYLSSMDAVKTLKGSFRSTGKEVFARKGLVVFQFSLSIILIVSTLIIYRQIQFTQQANLGYTKENLFYFMTDDQVKKQWNTFREQIENIPGVVSTSRTSHTFYTQQNNVYGLDWPDKDPTTRILFEKVFMDYGLLQTMDIELKEGRSYSTEYGANGSKIIFNERAIEVMGLDNPIGQVISESGIDREIIGVVNDFHFQSFRTEVNPLFFLLEPEYTGRAFVRIESSNISNTLSQIEEVYKTFNANYPFEYNFMDAQFASLYQSEMKIGALAKYFSIIAIFISCLGLFGLSAFTAEKRSKEIGVRKVLGANISSLVLMLSGDFTKLVLISIGISIPISWYLMTKWMEGFAYNSGLEWWIYGVAGLAALVIAWVTVSWQSIKAALMNPVDSLKSE